MNRHTLWTEMYGQSPDGHGWISATTTPRRQWYPRTAPTSPTTPRNLTEAFSALSAAPGGQNIQVVPPGRHGIGREEGGHHAPTFNIETSSPAAARPEISVKTEVQLLAESEVTAAAAMVDSAIFELARVCRAKAGLYEGPALRLGDYLAEDVALHPALALYISREMGTSSGQASQDTVDGMYVIATSVRNSLAESIVRTIKCMVTLLERSCDFAATFFACSPAVVPNRPIDPARMIISSNIPRSLGSGYASSDAHIVMRSLFQHHIAAPHAATFTRRKEHLMHTERYVSRPILPIINSYALSSAAFWSWVAQRPLGTHPSPGPRRW